MNNTLTIQRVDGRTADQLRDWSFERNFIKTAEGSVLVSSGDTKVIVTAKIEDRVPSFLKDKGQGWITSEYSMLPGCSQERIQRDRKKVAGRTYEIQRLIGRSLRAIVDLEALPEITITVDCDVIQADGGTRTASITGAYVAIYDCLRYLQEERDCFKQGLPIKNQVAAISVGIWEGMPILDLNYYEDSSAQADSNFVFTEDGKIIEIQGTAEADPFSQEEFEAMQKLAQKGIKELCLLQKKALG